MSVLGVAGVNFKPVIEWAVDRANDSIVLAAAAAAAQFVGEAIEGGRSTLWTIISPSFMRCSLRSRRA
eukprot:5088663-Pyramimonas_sp.AAC.1